MRSSALHAWFVERFRERGRDRVRFSATELPGIYRVRATPLGKADGKMVGDVKSPRILIADGALFKGNIDMDVER